MLHLNKNNLLAECYWIIIFVDIHVTDASETLVAICPGKPRPHRHSNASIPCICAHNEWYYTSYRLLTSTVEPL